MKKIIMLILITLLGISLFGLEEKDLYDAHGTGEVLSFFVRSSDEGVTLIYAFSGNKVDMLKYDGMIVLTDSDGIMRVSISYYISGNTIYITPNTIEIVDLEGNLLVDQKGGNLMVHSVIIQKTNEGLFLFLDGECYMFTTIEALEQ